jgi:hypothetical protein
MPEQRGAPRAAQLALSCDVVLPLRAVVTELSVTGMQVETVRPLHLDAVHEFRLVVGDSPIVLHGRVVHAHIAAVDGDVVTYVSGVQFLEVSPAGAADIANYLSHLSDVRRASPQ